MNIESLAEKLAETYDMDSGQVEDILLEALDGSLSPPTAEMFATDDLVVAQLTTVGERELREYAAGALS